MKKEKYDFIMIVLVYKNYNDLVELINSANTNIENIKIIIVNAFYDIKTNQIIKDIAEKNNCIFLSVQNKGYSYGNNFGLKYAKKYFIFKYAIISNPDIIIKGKIFLTMLDNSDIVAPKIIAKNGKNQNPMLTKENRFAELLIYKGFKLNKKFLLIMGIFIKKMQRLFFLIKNSLFKSKNVIYAAHGSFVFISFNSLRILNFNPYDENMFLFAEESVLAYKAKLNKLITKYNSNIIINHKEDGSMKLSKISINDEMAKSNIYFYENYILKNDKKRR